MRPNHADVYRTIKVGIVRYLKLRLINPSTIKRYTNLRILYTTLLYQYDLDPIQGLANGASEVPKIALFQVYLLRHFRMELKISGWW